MILASTLRLPLLGALLGLHMAAQSAPAPAVVSFDTTPRAGQHQRQTIDLQAVMQMRLEAAPEATEEERAKISAAAERMSQMGAMKMATQMEQTLKVGQPDRDGWLPLTVAVNTKGGSMEVGGKAVPLPNAKATNISYAGRFNPQDFGFEMQKVAGMPPEMEAFMQTQGKSVVAEALQLFKALSQRPLKVGDSVDVPLAMALPVPMPGGAGAMQGVARYTLARVERGVAHFDLTMDLDMDVTAPLPTPNAAAAASAASAPEAASAASAGAPELAASEPAATQTPKTLQMKIVGSGKGTSALRLSDRLPLASRLAMDMKMRMNGPDHGVMTMDMDMVVQAKGESLAKSTPAKAAPKKKN